MNADTVGCLFWLLIGVAFVLGLLFGAYTLVRLIVDAIP